MVYECIRVAIMLLIIAVVIVVAVVTFVATELISIFSWSRLVAAFVLR